MSISEIEEIWITSRDASERFGYTSDYVAFLCRTGKIIARRAGRSWKISEISISEFASRARQAEEIRHTKLREERRKEYIRRAALLSPQSAGLSLSTRRAMGNVAGALILLFAFSFGAYALPSTIIGKSFANIGTVVQSLPFGFERNIASALVAVSDVVSGETRTTTIPHLAFSWFDFFDKVKMALFGEPAPTAIVQAPIASSTQPRAQPTVTIVEKNVGPTTVVRNVSEYVTVTGVTYAELEAAIKALEARLISLIPQVVPFSGTPPITVVNTQTFAQSQRIDSLDGVTITNANIIGGTITGISGLGGGSGTVASGTVGQIAYYNANGSTLSATSSIFVSDTQRIGIATSSPLAQLTVYGDVLLSGANRYLNFGDANGVSGYGIRDNAGIIEFKNLSGGWSALGSSGTGGGTWSTTTSSVAGVLVNYSNNSSDIVAIGSTGTTTAEYWFDPNTLMAYFSGNVGLSTTTPFAKLAVQATAGQTNPVFQVSSSSNAVNFLTVAGDGFGTTTLTGLNVSGSATSTSNVGFNITTGCFAINGTCLGSSAFTSIGPAGQLQIGPNVTLATSSSAFNGLTSSTTITGSGNVITFTNTLAGLLGAAGGGTGLSSITQNQLLIGGAGNTWVQIATSSLGINFSSLIGTASDAQVDNNLTISGGTIDNTPIGATTPSTGVFTNSTSTNATTTNQNISGSLVVTGTSTLATTSLSQFSITGIGTSTIANNLSLGGDIEANQLFLNGATSTAANGFNIATGCFAVNGVCITSGSSGITAIGPTGQTQTGPTVTFATSSVAFNGLTSSTTITGAGNTLTFTNTLAGILGAAGGGTGLSSITQNQLLVGGAGNTWVQIATSSLGINFTDLVGSATDSQVDNNLTIVAGTIDNTPIGATTPSTGVFTNSTSSNATSTNLAVSSALTVSGTSTLATTSVARLTLANLTGLLRATAGVVS
ncbi:MAG: helix-turn-helix domain-containing protein, partial [Patescibacteria group bacterium]